MFEEEVDEMAVNNAKKKYGLEGSICMNIQECAYVNGFQQGVEFGYNKANEEAMMKLKDEGIVKPLKDSILRNERLSSQEQQELCAWIECAMEFGEKLDECARELEEAKKANEWHYPSKGELPEKTGRFLILNRFGEHYFTTNVTEYSDDTKMFSCFSMETVYAWKEIVLPELKESE